MNEKERPIKELKSNLDLDILIIGAGMTGMTTCYYLKDKKDIAILDASLYGHGVTLNSTAKITYLQEGNYIKIKNLCGINKSKIYLESQKDAIKYIKNIIDKEKIECDFKKTPSYLFANKENEIKSLRNEIEFLKENKVNIKKAVLPDKITSYESYKVDDTYTFNPIKYLDGIYNIIKDMLYENTKIVRIEKKDKYYCHTDKYIIKANKVILACHYPFFLLPFFLPIKSSIEKSYIIVSKVKKDLGFSAINISKLIYSCRYYQDGTNIYQISLGESHNSAFKQNDLYHFNRVKEIFNLDSENIVLSYSNVDIISHDYMPYIGEINDNMYISTGYNTWGMTNSILGAKIITDLINKKENKYVKIFNPLRKNLALFIKIPYTTVSQIKSFTGPKIIKNKTWYPDNIKFYYQDGFSLASYTDKEGKEHIIHNKCPHLGCSLIFNEQEKTWDCPCHSSRFDIDGICIKGPSTYDIKYKK